MIRVEKNSQQFIGLERQEYKGQNLIDIRVYQQIAGGRESVRTGKGITIRPDTAKSLLEALDSLINTQIETEPGSNN